MELEMEMGIDFVVGIQAGASDIDVGEDDDKTVCQKDERCGSISGDLIGDDDNESKGDVEAADDGNSLEGNKNGDTEAANDGNLCKRKGDQGKVFEFTWSSKRRVQSSIAVLSVVVAVDFVFA